MRADVARVVARGAKVIQVRLANVDLRSAGRIADLVLEETSDPELAVEVTLATSK